MKTLTIITMFLAMLAKDPTPTIQQFVKTYFPETTILFTQRDEGEYEVRLSDGTETSVPDALIPIEIANYVKASFPDVDIIKIDKDRRDWEIELSNRLEIKFDKKFRVLEYDD